MEYELCFVCGDETGRAGRGDDSIYCDECDEGPFCLGCYELHHEQCAAIAAAVLGEKQDTYLLDTGLDEG